MSGSRQARVFAVSGKALFGEPQVRLRHRDLSGCVRDAIPKVVQISDLLGLWKGFETGRSRDAGARRSPPFSARS